MTSSASDHAFQLEPLSTKLEIIRDLEAEVSIAELSGKYDHGEDLIRMISSKKNIVESSSQSKLHRHNLTTADKLCMLHYIDKGLSANKISRKFQTSQRTVSRVRSNRTEILELKYTSATLFVRRLM